MEYNKEKREIFLGRELNKLDEFVVDFIKPLKDYVIVSGYVSILFGRSRATEDIDLLVPKMNRQDFEALWEKIDMNGFECINTSNPEEAFEMLQEHAIRFAKKGMAIPNIEFKAIKNDLDRYSFDKRVRVILKKGSVFISSLEMQIAYKLSLGSEKDIEDARHLYKLFEEKIDRKELFDLMNKLNVKNKFELIK